MPEPEPKLRAPEALAVTVRSWLGPLSALSGRPTCVLAPQAATLVNASSDETEAMVEVDPLREADTGLAAPGGLTARIAPASIPARSPALVAITGRVPARPGAYASALRIAGGDGSAAVPIKLGVAASPAWGLASMLLGLLTVGCAGLLSTEGDLRHRQSDAVLARQELHERVEHDPVSGRSADDLTRIDREYDLALDALAARRPLGFIDGRLAEAEPHLAAAARLQAEFEHDMASRAGGDAAIADMQAAWAVYTDIAHQLLAPPTPSAPAAPAPASGTRAAAAAFADEIDSYMSRFAQRFVKLQANYDLAQIGENVMAAKIAAASGRLDEARHRAQATGSAIRVAFDALERAREVVEKQRMTGANLASNALQVRMQLDEEPDLDVGVRTDVTTLLDQAAAKLAVPGLTGHEDDLALAEANRLVSSAGTEVRQARMSAELVKLKGAISDAQGRLSLDDLEPMFVQLNAEDPSDQAGRIAALRRIAEAWRGKIGLLDPSARPAVEASIAAFEAILDSGGLDGSRPPLHDVKLAWDKAVKDTAIRAGFSALVPGCRTDARLVGVELAQLNEQLRQSRPRPQVADWAARAAAMQFDLDAFDPAGQAEGVVNCLNALFDLQGRLGTLNGEIFKLETNEAPIPDSERRRALTEAGMASPQEDVAPVALDVETPQAERVTGRAIRFALVGDTPLWAESDQVEIQFGDGVTSSASLGELKHGGEIVHRYESVPKQPLLIQVTAAGTLVGKGTQTLVVAPSPATAAQRLSDLALNARFALALLVGATLYAWRFHTGKTLFGARSFDYAEAYALGFAVNAIVPELPAKIAALSGIGGG